MASGDEPEIETLSSRIVYQNRWMSVREDAIRRQDGSHGIYGVVEKTDFAAIVPVAGSLLPDLQLLFGRKAPSPARRTAESCCESSVFDAMGRLAWR